MTIGEKIADLRREGRMTQRDLAEIINVSDKVISKWETGRALPDVESILRLSKAFNVSIAELFECIEKNDTDKAEEYNEERIWQYKKYSIISCFLLILSQVFIFLTIREWTYIAELRYTIYFLLEMLAIHTLFIALAFQVTQFIRLYSYAKGKHYQYEYRLTLKRYGGAFLILTGLIALMWAVLRIIAFLI